MDSDPQSALGHINRGIAAHREKNNEEAKRHFAQALLMDPASELGWLWFAEVADDPAEQRYCLNRAHHINPDTVGNTKRNQLSGIKPKIPQAIADLEHPPVPPSFRTPSSSIRVVPRVRLPHVRVRPARKRGADAGSTPTVRSEPARKTSPWLWLTILLALVVVGAIAIGFWAVQDEGPERFVAVVGPMSGPSSPVGDQMANSAQLSVDAFNRTHKGQKLGLLVFDDQNNPDLAVERAKEIVDDSRILAVIGHGTSSTSLAASPIYQEAGLAAITGQATADELAENPYYFRTIFDNSTEASLLSTYLHQVIKADTISIIVGPGLYEQTLHTTLQSDFAGKGTIKNTWELTAENRDASIQAIVDGIAKDPDAGTIVLALTQEDAHDVVLAIRRNGLNPPLFGSESIGSNRFAQLFADEPEESTTPGFFTEGIYAISPLIYDSIGGDALAFDRAYVEAYDSSPGWRGAKVYDAVTAGASAIGNASLSGKASDIANDRKLVVEQLRAINSPESALRGLSGLLYFEANGTAPQSFSIGFFTEGILTSAPIQYRLVVNPTQYDVDAEIKAGRAVQVGDDLYRQYRVAYVGLEMIELRDLDTTKQTYTADFFIYLRYLGDDAPLDVIFTNATNSGLGLGDPLESSTSADGLNYKLFRVQGTFAEPMNFESYPWDRHDLTIRLQNPILTQTDIVYVPDVAVLTMPQSERLVSGFDQSRPFNRIPSWTVDGVDFTQVAITSTADDYDTIGLVQFSEFRAGINLGRNVVSFLIKNLLPLALLALVTYIALWFPAEQAGTRISFSITALLTSSVMLGAISNQLPDIGYTVSIEWGYYLYIALAAVLVFLNIAVDRSFKAKRFARVRKLDILIRVIYPVAIIITVSVYWFKYA
ncbi:MAG TPA: ABC transporter substrate-binding protein [Thermomicrobiales bacterium]|nr:ABC transporter substrate-binding protein [Thermomicrobiales bacterium]